ncbi:MAG: GvpL/GvpF family gas vesicle protein [Desulfitobacteriaceae bacterium]
MSKNQIYLLGFIQNDQQLSPLGKVKLNLTNSGQHSALWIASPLQVFASKEEFLRAILELLEDIGNRKVAILPVKMGMSVPNITDLVELLNKYEADLKNFFKLVTGCCEYTLSLVPRDNSTRNGRGSGKDYIEFIKLREQQRKTQIKELEFELATICTEMPSALKDLRVEKTLLGRGNLEIAFLVRNAHEGDFQEQAANLTARLVNKYKVHWTGPWPAYHFVNFKFQAERYLTMESLNWSVGGEQNVLNYT